MAHWLVLSSSTVWAYLCCLDMYAHYAQKKALYLVTQFNHPRELTEEAVRAVRAMIERGVQVIRSGSVTGIRDPNRMKSSRGMAVSSSRYRRMIPLEFMKASPWSAGSP